MKKYLIFAILLLLPVFFVKADIATQLKGRILLQVESHGEAWYINPQTDSRFYLGRPADAFAIMRNQGLGISNKDFDAFKGVAPVGLSGRFLLKVEDLGKAYYVNPLDFKMYYLGRPSDAFELMRKFGLGISNANLNQVIVDRKSAEMIKAEEVLKPVEQPVVTLPEVIATSTDNIATSSDEVATTTEPIATSTACQFLVEYFDNKTLFGAPFSTTTASTINKDWSTLAPDGMIKTDRFSVRYTGRCYFTGGDYTFKTSFDDAIKVYLDEENFIQSWLDNARVRTIYRDRPIAEGYHDIKVEYYDNTGNAEVSVDWSLIQ
ncbi:PA14 domain-containing protein [Candidatus Parcubacteria bacterium]|nr:hypothetical protein [Patescibacteria group bacterium]MBU4308925.1 hypothetical protein [Patescibacteria group bacterium]MBU4431815.1 hypothetical protein [Patescibacteria group bacterium]MBU4577285.1 hypothetical protein [Patescibacteria group bacterium]MCG2696975.1 PA14 domain-containing protein [Candidatus Parcubacteria bacterium]